MIKKILVMMIMAVAGIAAANAALPLDKYTISRSELPKEAQKMLDEHFPKARVSMIRVDKHLLRKTDYDVKLTNGTKIEFSNKGKWTSVEVKKGSVPASLVHKTIQRHLQRNFADNEVRVIRKKVSGYEIRLCDGSELKYDLLGIFKSKKKADEVPAVDNDTESDPETAADDAA